MHIHITVQMMFDHHLHTNVKMMIKLPERACPRAGARVTGKVEFLVGIMGWLFEHHFFSMRFVGDRTYRPRIEMLAAHYGR